MLPNQPIEVLKSVLYLCNKLITTKAGVDEKATWWSKAAFNLLTVSSTFEYRAENDISNLNCFGAET